MFFVWGQSTRRINIQLDNQPEYVTSPSDLLSNFDLAEVPSGFLLEAGFELLDLSCVDGDPNKDYKIDIQSLREILSSIESMDVSSNTHLWDSIPLPTSSSCIPITIALYEYNKLSQSAFNQGLITYSDGCLYPSDTVSPSALFERHTVVAFAPSVTDIGFGQVDLLFRFADNCNLSYISLSVDLGDGFGFRPIQTGTIVHYNPPSTGFQTFTLKVSTTSDTFYAYSYVFVTPNDNPQYAPLIQPVGTSSSYLLDSIYYSTSSGNTVSASISYRPASSHNQTLIVVEGFDPFFSFDNVNNSGFTTIESIIHSLDYASYGFDSYDVYYIDWLNSEADIRDNAQLLKEAIRRINVHRHLNGDASRSSMLAQSMGGLITQYALREMELNGDDHEVNNVFYDDTPFKGVNVSPGVVMAFQSVWNYASQGILGLALSNYPIPEIKKYLYGKSAQQMSRNYINEYGLLDNTSFAVLQSELEQLGLPQGVTGYPIRNYAISDGGNAVRYSDIMSQTNNTLLRFSCYGGLSLFSMIVASLFRVSIPSLGVLNGDTVSSILSLIPGASRLEYGLEIYPDDGNHMELSHFTGVYKNKILGLFEVTSTFIDESRQRQEGMKSIERGFTSVYDIRIGNDAEACLDSSCVFSQVHIPIQTQSFGEIDFVLDGFVEAGFSILMGKSLRFVPSYSSLCMSETNSSIDRDFFSTPILGHSSCFDGYHLPDDNHARNHTSSIPWEWIQNQIDSRAEISIQDTVRVGSCFSMLNYNGQVRWASSYPSMVRINSSTGIITSIRDTASVTIVGYDYSNGAYFSRKKTVVAVPPDYPQLYITSGADAQGTYVILNSPDSDYEYYLDANNSPGLINWYYKIDSEALQLSGEPSRKFYIDNYINSTYDWLHITARIQDPVYPRPVEQEFLGFDFWCRKRLNWVFPRALLFEDGQFKLIMSSGEDPFIFDPLWPLLVEYDVSFPPRYTDQSITDVLTLRVEDDILFTQEKNNFYWEFPIFSNDVLMNRVEQILQGLAPGEAGFLRMTIENAEGIDLKDFVLPILFE